MLFVVEFSCFILSRDGHATFFSLVFPFLLHCSKDIEHLQKITNIQVFFSIVSMLQCLLEVIWCEAMYRLRHIWQNIKTLLFPFSLILMFSNQKKLLSVFYDYLFRLLEVRKTENIKQFATEKENNLCKTCFRHSQFTLIFMKMPPM